jgi:RimJ/RimL family protein N-acetyltransferase
MSTDLITPPPCLNDAGQTRLSMRTFTHSDSQDIVAMHKTPRVRDLLLVDHPLDDPRVTYVFIERLQDYYRANPGLGIWAADRWMPTLSPEDAATPEVQAVFSAEAIQDLTTPSPHFIGWFSLMRTQERPDELEIGGRLLPEAWGSGLALDGSEVLLDHAFDQLKQPHVWGISHLQHRSSHHIMLTLGAVYDGIRPYEGSPSRWFRIDAAAWREARRKPRKVRQREALKHMP